MREKPIEEMTEIQRWNHESYLKRTKKSLVEKVMDFLRPFLLAVFFLVALLGSWITVFEEIVRKYDPDSFSAINKTLSNLDLTTAFFMDNLEYLSYAFIPSVLLAGVVFFFFALLWDGLEHIFLTNPYKYLAHERMYAMIIALGIGIYVGSKLYGNIGEGYSNKNIFLGHVIALSVVRVFSIMRENLEQAKE